MSGGSLRCVFVVTMALATRALAGIGVFEKAEDIRPGNYAGSTQFVGMVEKDGELVERYLVIGHGDDIGGDSDQFHFAYRTVTGDWRVSADLAWAAKPASDWARMGVMIRDTLAENSVQYDTSVTNYMDDWNARTEAQWREVTGGGSASEGIVGEAAPRVGIQRVLIGGEIPVIESIADFGNGWERVGSLKIVPAIANEALFGVCVTSHDVWSTATATVTDVVYERAELIGPAPAIAVVPADAAKDFSVNGRQRASPFVRSRRRRPMVGIALKWTSCSTLAAPALCALAKVCRFRALKRVSVSRGSSTCMTHPAAAASARRTGTRTRASPESIDSNRRRSIRRDAMMMTASPRRFWRSFIWRKGCTSLASTTVTAPS